MFESGEYHRINKAHTHTDTSAVWGIAEHRSILKDILLTSRLDHEWNIKISICIIQQAPWILYLSITSCKDKHGLIHYVYGDSGSRGAVLKSVRHCECWREMIRTVPEIIVAVQGNLCRLRGSFYQEQEIGFIKFYRGNSTASGKIYICFLINYINPPPLWSQNTLFRSWMLTSQ